jgi:hypothetical protein
MAKTEANASPMLALFCQCFGGPSITTVLLLIKKELRTFGGIGTHAMHDAQFQTGTTHKSGSRFPMEFPGLSV